MAALVVVVAIVVLVLLIYAVFVPAYNIYEYLQRKRGSWKELTINGDKELLSFARKHNFPGDGTPENPVVIKNLGKITQQVRIYNVHLHVVIEDTVLEMPQYIGLSYDLYIENCSNIQIRNLTILYSDGSAIYILNSKNILIEDVSFYTWGCISSDIYVCKSSNVEIRRFKHYYNDNDEVGICIEDSSYIYIHDVCIGALFIHNSKDIPSRILLR